MYSVWQNYKFIIIIIIIIIIIHIVVSGGVHNFISAPYSKHNGMSCTKIFM